MNKYFQMIIALILSLLLCLLSGCSAIQTQPRNSDLISEVSCDTDLTAAENSSDKKMNFAPVTTDDSNEERMIDDAGTVKKFYPGMTNEEITDYNIKYYSDFLESKEHKRNFDLSNLIDNDTDIRILLKKNEKKITEKQAYYYGNLSVYSEDQPGECADISYIEFQMEQPLSFVRVNKILYNEDLKTTVYKCYTVFEVETGGYFYAFFNYYPEITDKTNSALYSYCYVPKYVETNDFHTIKAGASVEDVMAITPLAKQILMGTRDGYYPFYYLFCLCADGMVIILHQYSPDTMQVGNVSEIKVNSTSDAAAWWQAYYDVLPGDYFPVN